VETRYHLLQAAVLALATEIEAMHDRYVLLARHDPYLAQSYRITADELRRLVAAVERQELPCADSVAGQIARQAHRKAMIAAGEVEEG